MKLTDRQGFSLMTAFLLGNTIAVIGGVYKNSKSGYLSIILSFILFVLFAFMYEYIIKKNGYKGFFEIIETLFGKIVSKIIFVVLFIYGISAATFSTTNYTEFIKTSTHNTLPSTLCLILILAVVYYLVLSKEKTVARYSELSLPFVLLSIFIMVFSGLKQINLNNLSSIKELTVPEFFSTSFLTFLSPFAEMIFIYIIFDNLYTKKNITKIAVSSGALVAITMIVVYLFNLLILGKELLSDLYYPTFFAASVVDIGTITQKAESAISISYSFFDILYIAIGLLVALKALNKIMNVNKKITALIAVILIFIFIIFVENVPILYNIYPILTVVSIPITTILPISMFVCTLLRNKTHITKT